MIENTQLSRSQPGESRINPDRPPADQSEEPKSSEFDQRLQDQIDQARSAKSPEESPAEPVKTDDNQSLEENAEAPAKARAETSQAANDTRPLAVDLQPDAQQPVISGDIDSESVEAIEVRPPVAVPLDPEQSLPQDGKPLPPASGPIKSEAAVLASTAGNKAAQARPAAVTVEQPKLQQPLPAGQQTPAQQPVQTAALNTNAQPATDFLLPEGRLPVKGRLGQDTNNASVITAKTSLNMASAASAVSMASLMQQVPLTTSLASMHNATGNPPVAEGFFNTLTSPSTASLTASLNTPVSSSNWSQGVAERVAWMAQGHFQSAELKLNPAHLGPLEIKLSIQDDKATVHFVSHHATVREALDSAMPRLRDMLESQGLNLADVNVSDSGVQGNGSEAQTSAEQNDSAGSPVSANGEGTSDTPVQESLIPVDLQDGVSLYA